jgi:hypothetical protein
MAYFLITLIEDFVCTDTLSFFFIFLTNLSYSLQTFYGTLFFTIVVLARVNQRKVLEERDLTTTVGFHPKPKLPFLEKLLWVLMNVVHTIPFGVTAIYWIFLYKGGEQFFFYSLFSTFYFSICLIFGSNSNKTSILLSFRVTQLCCYYYCFVYF